MAQTKRRCPYEKSWYDKHDCGGFFQECTAINTNKLVQTPWHEKDPNQSHWPHFYRYTSICLAVLCWLSEDTTQPFCPLANLCFLMKTQTLHDPVKWCPFSSGFKSNALFRSNLPVPFLLSAVSPCFLNVIVHLWRRTRKISIAGWREMTEMQNSFLWLTVFRNRALGFVFWCCFL